MVDGIINVIQNMTNPSLTEGKTSVQLPKLSVEVRSMLAVGTLADLEVFLDTNQYWQAVLHAEKSSYNLPIEAKSAEILAEGKDQVSVPVKVLENGQLAIAKKSFTKTIFSFIFV
ncbi:MAG: hypothetical protein MJ210_00520, partial [Alphaproteobacteria bacterium]|nr:hypothetical protein [Alphaproteobacteria bacterium]